MAATLNQMRGGLRLGRPQEVVALALFGKRKPPFQLTGLVASSDGLYDGSFVVACARWWNHEVEARGDVRGAGYRPFTADEVRQLCAVVQPENRRIIEAFASGLSIPGRYSGSVLSLSYALALVINAGASQTAEAADAAPVWRQAPPFTENDLTELARHYNQEGAAREYASWAPYWMAAPTVFGDRFGPRLIASARQTFDDQVDRWSSAEGFDLRQSIGEPDYSLIAFDENAGLPNFVELLFEWGGRLRLGEQLLSEGSDFAELRFNHDEYDPIEHFYEQAFERYIEIASHDDPDVGDEIVFAVRSCAEWLGEDKTDRERLAISTAALRGYLWRTVEEGPVDFLEPDLSHAVERSRSVGEGRTPDDERFGLTLFFAASQCMDDGVHVRMGSLGGLIQGPKFYEKAFFDTTDDFEELGLELNEDTKRLAFQFGVCLADSERVLTQAAASD